MVTEKQGKGVSAKSTTPKPREIKERIEYEQDSQEKSKKEASTNSTAKKGQRKKRVRTVQPREVKERSEYEQYSQGKSKKEASTSSTAKPREVKERSEYEQYEPSVELRGERTLIRRRRTTKR
jgi:hypothetical protein